MSAKVILVMGVSGAGKSTVGRALAARLGWPFQEGDDLHPAANIAKMASGAPLTDADRAPWLERIKAWIDQRLALGQSGVVACSALKRAYRDQLVAGRRQVVILYLKADKSLLQPRLRARHGHFMPPALLDSQLETLEAPGEDEDAIVVEARRSLDDQLRTVMAAAS
jgi:gluconokinase